MIAVSCLDSWHEEWLRSHPSCQHGFPIHVRDGGDMDGFRPCIDQHFAHYGLNAIQAFLENGVQVLQPDWSDGWPTERYERWRPSV